MKRIMLLSLAVAVTGCGTTVTVDSADEFLRAIGPNRTIRLAPGEYVLSDVPDRHEDYLRWDPAFDGKTITVRRLENLTIRGCGDGPVRLLVRPRYAYVLSFEDCRNVALENLVMGHAPAAGYCTGGVLRATNCANLSLRRCDLFGCGTEGLTLAKTTGVAVRETVIRDCTYGIMSMKGCRDIRFARSTFTRNEEFWAVAIHDSRDITFTGCRFTANRANGKPLFDATSCSNVRITSCTMFGNEVAALTNNPSAVTIADGAPETRPRKDLKP